MTSSRTVARAFAACLGFLLVAGSARAQFEECPIPSSVPEIVFFTIVETADLDFGALEQDVCDSIVKKGVAGCKAQTKLAAKCGQKAAATLYDIMVKQCAQIEDVALRTDCKESAKTFRTFNHDGYATSMAEGLEVCEVMFASALDDACMGVMKSGGP